MRVNREICREEVNSYFGDIAQKNLDAMLMEISFNKAEQKVAEEEERIRNTNEERRLSVVSGFVVNCNPDYNCLAVDLGQCYLAKNNECSIAGVMLVNSRNKLDFGYTTTEKLGFKIIEMENQEFC